MIGKRKLIIILGALIFSFGMFSVGFGFWTDQLNLEGDADVKLSIKVTDDIINVEYTTSDAVQLIENQALPDNSGTGESSSNSTVDSTAPIIPEEPPADFSEPEEQPADTGEPSEQPAVDPAVPVGPSEQPTDSSDPEDTEHNDSADTSISTDVSSTADSSDVSSNSNSAGESAVTQE